MQAGLTWWLAVPLAWVLGVTAQLFESRLHPGVGYGVAALVSGAVCAGVLWWRRAPWMVPVFVALLAWGTTGWRTLERASQSWPISAGDQAVRVQVDGLPQPLHDGGWRFDAVLLEAPGLVVAHTLPQRVRLFAEGKANMAGLRSGQTWALTVRMHEPDGFVNPGGFDSARSMFEDGIRATGNVRWRVEPPVLIREPGWMSLGWIDRFRQRVRERVIERVGEGRVAGVLVGLAVGDQSAIDREDWALFRTTGVAHAVSISGTHVAMLGWLVAFVARRMWPRWRAGVHRWPTAWVAPSLAVVASVLYALVSGWGVPAQRTVVMMAVMAVVHGTGRRWPWPLTWLVAAACITALDPWALRQPGFWLSFIAVAILMSSSLGEVGLREHYAGSWRAKCRDAVKDLVRTQWRVTVALAPLALVCFQEVSLVGMLANLLAIPVFTLGITPLALFGILFSPLWEMGAALVTLTTAILTQIAQWPWAVWHAPVLPGWAQCLAVIGGWLWVQPVTWAWRWMVLPCFMPVLMLPQGWRLVAPPPDGQFVMTAADVGQGTAVLIQTTRHALLFDTGGRFPSGMDMGERVLVPMLRSMGVRALDTLVISHADLDHVGGALSILQQLPVHQLRSSLPRDHPVAQWRLKRHQAPISHQSCLDGQWWEWDGVKFEFLHPYEMGPSVMAQAGERGSNGLSCVLKVSSRSGRHVTQSVLLTGDIEAKQEARMLAQHAAAPERLRSTVLMAPHHGSKTSSTGAFLQAVAPQEIVVQAGRRNRYGHPAPSVLSRYEALGVPVHITSECGAYVWRSHEKGPGQCWADSLNHPWSEATGVSRPFR